MKTLHSQLPSSVRLGLAASLLLAASAQPAFAIMINPDIAIHTELLSFGPDGINGEVFLPLTGAATTSSMAGAPAATADGYGWVNSNMRVDLSTTTPSTGQASFGVPTNGGCQDAGEAGDVSTGDTVCVDSFYDIFYYVTFTDIDTTTGTGFFDDSATGPLVTEELGPRHLQFIGECIADTSKENLGCLPPVGFPYIGFFEEELDLGYDVNGNGEIDVLKFIFGALDVGGVTNTFINGNQVIDEFDSTLAGDGAVMNVSTDPPFTFTLTGPTTASQDIVYPSASVPEPTTFALFGVGIALMGLRRRRQQ